MAIKNYFDQTGREMFKVSVSLRSKINPGLRVQKAKFCIESKAQAKKEEQLLLREAVLELKSKESQSESWQSLIDQWIVWSKKYHAHEISHLSVDDYAASLKKHTATWLKRPASSIVKGDVLEMLMQMKINQASPAHQIKIKNRINRIFQFGMDQGLIKNMDRSPAWGVRIENKVEKKPEILNINEIRRLLECARELKSPWYFIWAMALFTGMRSGELYALQWSDVDFESRVISVTKSYNGRLKAIKSTKAGWWRTVPISSELEVLLKEIRVTTGKSSNVLPKHWLWTRGMQAVELRKFCVGINLPSIKFHTLRACFATQLIRNGIPPIQIQKICGWRDLETMQRYIRLAGIEVEGATEGLKLLPDETVMGKVVNLFTTDSNRR